MSDSKILFAAIEAFKQKFSSICQNSTLMIDKLNDNSFNAMSTALMDAAREAGQAGLKEYLKEHDTVSSTITKNGAVLRYKGNSRPNELLTLFGTISVERAMYYDEKNGGQYFFPLDSALGLDKDDFATLETREMILFATASCVPRELKALLDKCSLCKPSRMRPPI
jgi:hypothetical protein